MTAIETKTEAAKQPNFVSPKLLPLFGALLLIAVAVAYHLDPEPFKLKVTFTAAAIVFGSVSFLEMTGLLVPYRYLYAPAILAAVGVCLFVDFDLVDPLIRAAKFTALCWVVKFAAGLLVNKPSPAESDQQSSK